MILPLPPALPATVPRAGLPVKGARRQIAPANSQNAQIRRAFFVAHAEYRRAAEGGSPYGGTGTLCRPYREETGNYSAGAVHERCTLPPFCRGRPPDVPALGGKSS